MAAMEPLDVRSLVHYDEEDAVVLLGLAMAILWQVGHKGIKVWSDGGSCQAS